MTNVKDLQWEEVPTNWALCFNHDCNKCDSCLRYAAGSIVPRELTVSNCVLPNAILNDGCLHYAPIQKWKYARGFSRIFEHVLKKDFTLIRSSLTNYLRGKRYYYEYKRGEKRLSPEQQDYIRQLFSNFGYIEECFDLYEEAYHFSCSNRQSS